MPKVLAVSCLVFSLCVSMANAMDLKDWKVTGDVGLDSSKVHKGSAASIKVGPGGKAVKMLRAEDGSGKVTIWVYDDNTAPADPKAPRVGPTWGIVQSDGKMLIAGMLYARYLSGDTGYTAAAGLKDFYRSCQWLSTTRTQGWRKWDFILDADKGFSMKVDDKPVKFDWNKEGIVGFNGIVLMGDEATGDKKQTLWVDDVNADLGGPMKIKPVAPPPPAPVLQDKDPAATESVPFTPATAGKHPRLLLSAERISQVRDFYNSDKGAMYREELLSVIPGCVVPANRKMDTAWGQQVGLFDMPSVAMHYVLTKDKGSFDKCVAYLKWLVAQPDWTTGGAPEMPFEKAMDTLKKMTPAGEVNSDTTAAFTMVGTALMYDWLYNDLDAQLREQVRQALWQHARYMYYGGHMARNPGGDYWRGTPMYNHRWFRNWGMTFAALAAAEGKPEEQWLLGKIKSELQFTADWLPADGSNHEGPGYGASSGALGMTYVISDACLGTRYFDQPFFHNLSAYAMQLNAPGMKEAIYFSDCFTKARSVHPFYMLTAARAGQPDVLDGMRHVIALEPNAFGINGYAWLSLLSDDPKMAGGDYKRLPTTALFPDLGLCVLRESWGDKAVAAMFKSGPPGGYNLQSWRTKGPDGQLPYVNVAHDHPDANSFTIIGDGDYIAETNRYPLKPGKNSTGHNTILINGMGQTPPGRPENYDWLQPSSQDMTQMARLTAWKDAGDVVVIEGEASGAYTVLADPKTKQKRPALDRFRRTFIWVKGGYILVLDDVRAPAPVSVTWMMQGAKLQSVDEAKGIYRLSKNAAQCEFQLLSDAKFQTKMAVSTANDHNKLLNWQQLQATADGKAMRFVSIYDPWHKGDLKVTFTPEGAEKAAIVVTGSGINDKWDWQAATARFEAASIHGVRQGGFDVVVDAKTAAPPDTLPKK